MSGEEADRDPILTEEAPPNEEPVENTNNAMDAGTAEENVDVVQEQYGNGQQEDVVNDVDDVSEGADDLTNPTVFRTAVRRMDDCYMSIIRALSAFSREEDEVYSNAITICSDIISIEESLFSPIPDYAAKYMRKEYSPSKAYSKVSGRETIPTQHGSPRTWEDGRTYVNPGVPLQLPYDAERFKEQHPGRVPAEGTYHNLFYGDGSECVFVAPEDNKRKQLEDAARAHPRMKRRAPPVYDPAPKKPMKVSSNFVPACADTHRYRGSYISK